MPLLSFDKFGLDRRLVRPVKVLAIVVTATALALELCNLYIWFSQGAPLQRINALIALGWFVLICHGVEGAIAAALAPSRQQSPLKFGVYTFFVGTIGLLELFRPSELQR